MLSVVLRLLDPVAAAGRMCGELEVVRTGERHRFRDVDELVVVLERLQRDAGDGSNRPGRALR